jgi:hypothetical protein
MSNGYQTVNGNVRQKKNNGADHPDPAEMVRMRLQMKVIHVGDLRLTNKKSKNIGTNYDNARG